MPWTDEATRCVWYVSLPLGLSSLQLQVLVTSLNLRSVCTYSTSPYQIWYRDKWRGNWFVPMPVGKSGWYGYAILPKLWLTWNMWKYVIDLELLKRAGIRQSLKYFWIFKLPNPVPSKAIKIIILVFWCVNNAGWDAGFLEFLWILNKLSTPAIKLQ